MKKVITYGTFDMLHRGHIRLLERAKALGDYLIVGVTSDTFDRMRGKINVKQSLQERVDSVKATGLADEIIIEEYEGQKIDDIRRYDIDVFTVGSDWKGKFDYLNEYCHVVYLERTKGVSSTAIREQERNVRVGIVGDYKNEVEKFIRESEYVNGVNIAGIYTNKKLLFNDSLNQVDSYEDLLDIVDAVYIISNPANHYEYVKKALDYGKHVLCESPIAMDEKQCKELFTYAESKDCILMESIKTAYSLAFSRLLLLVKGGIIGRVVSVDATCTSLNRENGIDQRMDDRGSLYCWGPLGLFSVFSLLGTEYRTKMIQTKLKSKGYDTFTKISFVYDHAVASMKVANGVKSEGELVISGTDGYIFVPAPWWKTDYFEVRYENLQNNRRYFYPLEGEGIRYMLVCFAKAIRKNRNESYIPQEVTNSICGIIEDFNKQKDTIYI